MQTVTMRQSWWIYGMCALAVLAVASMGGLFRPDAWFVALKKPVWNPPSWIFGPVWTTLYVMIAIAGGRVFSAAGDRTAPRRFWIVQLVLNGLWSLLFFGLHRIDLALIDIVGMVTAIAGFVGVTWKKDRIAAWLFLPYLAWVSFATVLNATLLVLNRG